MTLLVSLPVRKGKCKQRYKKKLEKEYKALGKTWLPSSKYSNHQKEIRKKENLRTLLEKNQQLGTKGNIVKRKNRVRDPTPTVPYAFDNTAEDNNENIMLNNNILPADQDVTLKRF